MPKITRVLQKIFAGNSNNSGVFGSAAADTFETSSDIAEIQSLSAWEGGWQPATLTSLRLPALNELEGVSRVVTQQIAYLLQEGIPEYNSDTVYYENSIVKETGTVKLYKSLTVDNEGNALTDGANWELLIDFDAIVPFNNLSATTDPTASNDETEGYVIGSLWVNETNNNAFIAVDVSEGVAIWLNLNIENFLDGLTEETAPQGALFFYEDPSDYGTKKKGAITNLVPLNNFTAIAEPTATDDETDGYSIGSQWVFNGILYTCTDASTGAAVWLRVTNQVLTFESSAQSIVSAGTLTIPHGLGGVPDDVWCYLKCTTADAGYSIGDEIIIRTYGTADSHGFSLRRDATNLLIKYSSTAQVFQYVNLSTGAANNLTNTRWEAYFKAVRYT